MLFWVDTRGVDSRRPLPLRSRAVNATSRLNERLIDPSARPTPLVAAVAPRLTAVGTVPVVVAGSVGVGPWTPPTRPPRLALFGNARFVVFPSDGSTRPMKPHCTPRALANVLFV